MTQATKLQLLGNQIKVIYDDGNVDIGQPTQGGIWIVTQNGGPGPGPGDSAFRWPFSLAYVTSEFRPPDRPTHDGMDFSGGPAVLGKPDPACADASVYLSGSYFGYGYAVILDHGTLTTGSLSGHNIKTLYGHHSRLDVNAGQDVVGGQQIGLIGSTGESTGPHLHFEVWVDGTGASANKINPRTFMTEYNPTNEFIYG